MVRLETWLPARSRLAATVTGGILVNYLAFQPSPRPAAFFSTPRIFPHPPAGFGLLLLLSRRMFPSSESRIAGESSRSRASLNEGAGDEVK